MPSKWNTTTIWGLLTSMKNNASADSTRNLLMSCMDNIELILAKSGTAPTDFTLHDEEHSYRVAERMIDVIPAKVLAKLSSFELGLLLLSSYLHDIGMSPRRDKVQTFYDYLITGVKGTLNQNVCEEFQKWLDEEGYEVTPPLITAPPKPDDFHLASEIITYYARHKHNDWSKEWIEENLTSLLWKGYANWTDDLIDLCQSHHWGYDKLLNNSFDPKLLHSKDIVHIRYLACVLRIADVIENDPERTPSVIFRHRNIAPNSQIYWWKDHEFILQVEKNRSVTLRARPKNAVIHSAILKTAELIEQELQLCDRLSVSKPFNLLAKHDPLPHNWDLPNSLWMDIRPYKDSYVYIEGAFRPDTQRILQILGGLELYGNHLSAIRELLQNAFDAVRESIAYERLAIPEADNPADSKWMIELGNRHHINLTIEEDSDDNSTLWLVCRDDGIGMTKTIIENYLLVSGNSRRRDVIALERNCKAKNFSSERTGKFGIGVLSYFMIADEVQITTRRSQITRDADYESWTFKSTGVGDFGELRSAESGTAGTEVRLKVKSSVNILNSLKNELLEYVKSQIAYSPCQLIVKDDCSTEKFLAGWLVSPEAAISEYGFKEDDILQARKLIQKKVEEGELPEGLGRYRIFIHYFALSGGLSLAYFKENVKSNQIDICNLSKQDCIPLNANLKCSYKGITVESNNTEIPNYCTLNIDFTSENSGTISVNREKLTINEKGRLAIQYVIEKVKASLITLLENNQGSTYDLFNHSLGEIQYLKNHKFNWLGSSNNIELSGIWGPVNFPAVLFTEDLLFGLLGDHNLKNILQLKKDHDTEDRLERFILGNKTLNWNGNQLQILRKIKGLHRDKNDFWDTIQYPPDRMLIYFVPGFIISAVPLWINSPILSKSPYSICSFPPTWKNVFSIKTDAGFFVNNNHTLFNWNRLNDVWSKENEDYFYKLLINLFADDNSMRSWNMLNDHFNEKTKEFFDSIWNHFNEVDPSSEEILSLKVQSFDESELLVISKDGARLEQSIECYLPKVDDDWKIQFSDSNLRI